MKTVASQEQEPVDLYSEDSRTSLAKAVTRLFDLWEISTTDQCSLLGLSPSSRMTLSRYRKGNPLCKSIDLIGRVGHLLGIHKALRILFPHNREEVYSWVSTHNANFGGRSPLELMRAGYEGLLTVRRYLDFEMCR